MIKNVKRGEVYLADMDNGFQEVLIIQNNKGNYYSPTTIVLEVKGVIVNYFSVRTIDKIRLIQRVRQFNTYQMVEVNEKLATVILSIKEPVLV